MAADEFDFLTLDDITAIHAEQLALYGGSAGIIDQNVIESSLAAPRWTFQFGGDVADCAAAYLYHFAASQGFADGNKRTAVVAAVEFLGRNGYRLIAGDTEMYDLTMSVANKLANKQTVGEWFRQRLAPMP